MNDNYKKPPLTFDAQIKLLQERGLIIEDEFAAKMQLKNISYYRLSGYMYPLLEDKANHIFKHGSTFEKVLMLYNFDRELRLLIFDPIEKIEIAFRTQLIYHLSHEYGPWWFEKNSLFSDQTEYAKQLLRIEETVKESDEQFIHHFFSKYNQPNPPAWMVMEISSFNQISRWYKNLLAKDMKKKIAMHFDSNYIELESWLHAITYLRNLCAHHSRLWNRRLAISPKFPENPSKQFINIKNVTNSRLYFTLSIMLYFINALNTESSFKENLLKLFTSYSEIDKSAMGFPPDWEKEPLWQVIPAPQ